jgi:hypothetical protein
VESALDRIAAYFVEFKQSIENCRNGSTFRSADWKEAYGALGRLRGRYGFEKENLTAKQQAPLRKVFEDDPFIEGMMDFRQVAEHVVVRRGGPLIRTTSNAPIQLNEGSSAMAVFAAPVVTLDDVEKVPRRIDHLVMLEEAERRTATALAKAREVSERT